MKILFFIALLLNIVFFLWESKLDLFRAVPTSEIQTKQELKQILLVSELSQGDVKTLKKEASNINVAKFSGYESINKITPKTQSQSTKNEIGQAQNHIEKLAETTEVKSDGNMSEHVENVPARDSLKQKKIVETLVSENELINKKNESNKKVCFEFGPFVDNRALKLWLKLNKINAGSYSQVRKKSKVASTYLVYHPAEVSYEKSKEIFRSYKQKNISDVWLFRKGDLKGTISFGLFSSEIRALRLQKKLLKTGVNVEIKQRYKTEILPYVQVLTEDELFRNKVAISDKQIANECK